MACTAQKIPGTSRLLSVLSRWGLACALVALALSAWPGTILFDATKHEMAGNADWVIDADLHTLSMTAYATPSCKTTSESDPQRIPTPAQSGIAASTAETYWTGGISSWGIDLVKAGHTVETLPNGGRITYGDGTNAQDLSHYQLYIVVEPQNPFTSAEKSAIIAFVNAGGGLFMVGDHETSDRDCDGWESPKVWNDLMGATSTTSTGIFGLWMRELGSQAIGPEDWFDDGTDNNVETDPADPIIHGPFGSGVGGLGFFGATSMDINTADNPTVTAHVWRTGQAHNNLRVTFATASYGAGRVAAIGDSSPADDGTGDSGDTLYGGWDKAVGGVNNREIHLNACAWLLNPAPDTTPPVITGGPSAGTADCSAMITWTTDEASTSTVQYGLSTAYGSTATASGYVQSHTVNLTGLTPGTPYHYRVGSSDATGNGPTWSGDASFTTGSSTAPVITVAPAASGVSGTVATITWSTNEAATSQVDYGTTTAYGSSASSSGYVTAHSVPLSSLTPETQYHYKALSTDACGNGPTESTDATFATGPASISVSGWAIKQFTSTLTYTIPAGTTIPSGGYLVVARDATRAEFETFFAGLGHAMPAETVFLNSNASGSCTNGCLPQINGSETFELWNTSAKVEGPTIAMSQNNAYQRTSPCGAPGTAGSWTTVVEGSANPGQGAGTACGAGVIINEMADASDYTKEFVELYYDAGSSPADTVPPAPITDLRATPISDTSVRLDWTATGDDGTTGTAALYDMRRSNRRILTEADFSTATPLSGEPAPLASGSAQQMTVGGLTANTSYYFALKASDEKPNVSGLSNCAWATTASTGGGGTVNHLVISQFQVAGSTDDFVEIYNPTGAAISLTNYTVRNLSAAGGIGFSVTFTAGRSVASHGYYLAAANGYSGSVTRDDSLGVNNFSGTAGHVLLVNKTTALTVPYCSDPAIVDKVGYAATATCPEGGSGHNTPLPPAGQSCTRKPGGSSGSGQDTNVNNDDFLAAAASTPHNSSSTPATPPSPLGNVGWTLYLTKGASETDLAWGSACAATAYHVYRGTAPNFMAGSPSPWQAPTATSTLDTAAPSSVLYYVIRATDGTNESAD